MVKLTLDDARKLNLADAAARVVSSREGMMVSGPQGALVKLVPVTQPAPAYFWKGRPVYTQEQLAAMTPEELEAIGWIYPDESAWMEEIQTAGGAF